MKSGVAAGRHYCSPAVGGTFRDKTAFQWAGPDAQQSCPRARAQRCRAPPSGGRAPVARGCSVAAAHLPSPQRRGVVVLGREGREGGGRSGV